jgi:hypothetical protein
MLTQPESIELQNKYEKLYVLLKKCHYVSEIHANFIFILTVENGVSTQIRKCFEIPKVEAACSSKRNTVRKQHDSKTQKSTV